MLNCSDKCFRVSWEQFTIKDSLHPEYSTKVTLQLSLFRHQFSHCLHLDTVFHNKNVCAINTGYSLARSSIAQIMFFIIKCASCMTEVILLVKKQRQSIVFMVLQKNGKECASVHISLQMTVRLQLKAKHDLVKKYLCRDFDFFVVVVCCFMYLIC